MRILRIILSLLLILVNLAPAPAASAEALRKALDQEEANCSILPAINKQESQEKKENLSDDGRFPAAAVLQELSQLFLLSLFYLQAELNLQSYHLPSVRLFLLFHTLIFYH